VKHDHGSASTYCNYGCRCVPCTEAHRAAVARQRSERSARLTADPSAAPHGRASTYLNWGCRCEACRSAEADRQRNRRA